MSKPLFVMMMGLPGSGKTYSANILADGWNDVVVLSSDDVREELCPGDYSKEANKIVFTSLKERTNKYLSKGKGVFYDATNLSKKRRIQALNDISVPCVKICIVCLRSYEDCVEADRDRDSSVGAEVLMKMYKSFEPPHSSEGWDDIILVFPFGKDSVENAMESFIEAGERTVGFNQHNPHHSLTLEEHLVKTESLIPKDPDKGLEWAHLSIAAGLHDIGKPVVGEFKNAKGEFSEIMHFYHHENVGAYLVLLGFTAFKMLKEEEFIHTEDLLQISNLVYYHMHPVNRWQKSDKSYRRDMNLLGEKMVRQIEMLSRADVEAK